MPHPSMQNIGAYLRSAGASNAPQGLVPAARSAGTAYGAAFALDGAKSCVLSGLTGAATGTPDASSVTFSLQVAADSGFTTPVDVANSSVALTAASKGGEVDVLLQDPDHDGCLYARVKVVTAFTGGSTPTILSAAVVTLGGFQNLPV